MAKKSRWCGGLLVLIAAFGCSSADDPERSDRGEETIPEGELDAARPADKLDGSLDATRPDPLDAAVTPGDGSVIPRDASPIASDATTPATPTDAQTPSATQTAKADSKEVWSASGFQVQAGRCYDLSAKIDDKWLDLDVPSDLSGWIDKQDPRLALFTPFRRVVQDDIAFYQFATCVNKQLDQCFAVGANTTICPKIAGELFFFVNDASGFESNNVGTATVTFRAK